MGVVGIARHRRSRRRAGARGQNGGEAIFGVIAVGEGAVVGEVAVAVVPRAHGADSGVLVESAGV